MVTPSNFKKIVGGKEVYEALLQQAENNQQLSALRQQNPEQYKTFLNEIRKLAFGQSATAYSSSVSEGDRIGKPDYEQLAKAVLAEKGYTIGTTRTAATGESLLTLSKDNLLRTLSTNARNLITEKESREEVEARIRKNAEFYIKKKAEIEADPDHKDKAFYQNITAKSAEELIQELDTEIEEYHHKLEKVDELELSEEQRFALFKEVCKRLQAVYPYTRNQTPHPTLTDTTEKFQAEANLVDVIRGPLRDVLTQGDDAEITQADQNLYNEALNSYVKEITPLLESLNIDGEMRMSLYMSHHMYRSVPEDALSLLRVAEKVFGLDPQSEQVQDIVAETSSKAIRNETWSPGDVDSKPHMRPALMTRGIEMGRLAIRRQYIQDLAEIGHQLPEDSEARQKVQATIWKLMNDIKELYVANPDYAGAKIDTFINRIMKEQGASDQAIEFVKDIRLVHHQAIDLRNAVRQSEKALRSLKSTGDDNQLGALDLTNAEEAHKYNLDRLKEFYKSKGIGYLENINNIGYSLTNGSTGEYQSHSQAFFDDLKDIEQASKDAELSVPFKDVAGKGSHLSAIKALRIQAESYGLQAQKITHRQAHDVYDTALDEIHLALLAQTQAEKPPFELPSDYIENSQKLSKLLTPEKREELAKLSSQKAELEKTIEQLKSQNIQEGSEYETAKNQLDTVSQQLDEATAPIKEVRSTLVKSLIEMLNDTSEKNAERNASMRRFIRSETEQNMSLVRDLQRRLDNEQIDSFTPEEQRMIYTYESLQMAKIGMYSDGAIVRELIAETTKPEDLWNVMALQELMINPEHPPLDKNIPKIVPLVEYTEDLRKLPEIMAEAYAFEPFRKAQEKRVKNDQAFVKVWDEEKQDLRDMTTRDLVEDIIDNDHHGRKIVAEMIDAYISKMEDAYPGTGIEESLKTSKKFIAEIIDVAQEIEHLEREIETIKKDRSQSEKSKELTETLKERKDRYTQAWDIATRHPILESYLNTPAIYSEAMTAGSDMNKSSSSAFVSELNELINSTENAMATYSSFLNMKSGNGSAAHRNAVNNALIRMRQGREMWRGPEILSTESERVRTIHAGDAMGKRIGVKGERRFVAVTNLSNAANLKDQTGILEYEDILARDEARTEAYKNDLYHTAAFSQFFDTCAPRKLFGMYKFAARPAQRLKASGDFRVEAGIRAIGFGLNSSTLFGEPHLLYGLSSNVLKADELGSVTDENRKENATLYLKSPDMQNEVNRAIVNLVHYNPDVAWQNTAVGCGLESSMIERTVDTDGEIHLTIKNGETTLAEVKLSDLAKGDESALNALKSSVEQALEKSEFPAKYKDKFSSDTIVSNMRVAAKLDIESTNALRSVNQLISDLAGSKAQASEADPTKKRGLKEALKRKDKDTPRLSAQEAGDVNRLVDNLRALSPNLADELDMMREVTQGKDGNPGTAQQISEIFERSVKDPASTLSKLPGSLPKDPTEWTPAQENYMRDFHVFKRHTDIVEYVPAAYYEPGHSVAMSRDVNKPSMGMAA